jgi:hypothetical protein
MQATESGAVKGLGGGVEGAKQHARSMTEVQVAMLELVAMATGLRCWQAAGLASVPGFDD